MSVVLTAAAFGGLATASVTCLLKPTTWIWNICLSDLDLQPVCCGEPIFLGFAAQQQQKWTHMLERPPLLACDVLSLESGLFLLLHEDKWQSNLFLFSFLVSPSHVGCNTDCKCSKYALWKVPKVTILFHAPLSCPKAQCAAKSSSLKLESREGVLVFLTSILYNNLMTSKKKKKTFLPGTVYN